MVKIMILCLTAFWIASFSISRLFVFYQTYTAHVRLLKDESFLRTECANPEFFSNMRRHSDVCIDVQRNAELNPIFVALDAVANTAHLCGRYSCSDVIIYLSNGGWPVLLTVGFTCLFAPMMLAKAARVLVQHNGDSYGARLPMSKMA